MTCARVFELARRIREASEIPIVFYTYYNLVFSNGVDAYLRSARPAYLVRLDDAAERLAA